MAARTRIERLRQISTRTGPNAFVTKVMRRTKHRANAGLSITRGLRCLAAQNLLSLPLDEPNEPLELILRDSEHSDMFAHPVYAYNVDPRRPLVVNVDPESSDAACSNGIVDGIAKVTIRPDGTPASGAQEVIYEVWPIDKTPTREEWSTVRSKLALRTPGYEPMDEESPGGPRLFLNIRDAEAYIRVLHYSGTHPAYLTEDPVNHKRAYTAINFAPRHVAGTELEESSISLEQVRGYGFNPKNFEPNAGCRDPVMHPQARVLFRDANARQVATARENRLRRLRNEVATRVGGKRPAVVQDAPRKKARTFAAPKAEYPGAEGSAQDTPPRQKRAYKKRASCKERRGSELAVGVYSTPADNEERAYRAAMTEGALNYAGVLHTVLGGLIANHYD